jgi:NitT/TauT family transport system substrate-binding protein
MKRNAERSVEPVIPAFDLSQSVRRERREFVKGLTALAGAASLFGYDLRLAAAEPPPETTRIRLVHAPDICLAPQYLAEELLRLEGFSQIEYVRGTGADPDANILLVEGKADLTLDTVTALVPALDGGRPIVVLAGIHGGCYELFGNERVGKIRDLKGKRASITALGSGEHVYIASMMLYVGMDPRKDITWVEGKTQDETMRLFVDGEADAFLAFPPQPQRLRAKKIGRVIVDTSHDKPWSQYFCCMLAGHREFVRKHPVATKRALRAILKATDICAREPERAARYLVKKDYEPNYDIALEVVKEVSYNAWRTFDPDSTLRFHALRLHEVGMIKSTPQKLIAQGTDWRFLNELKRELKA